MNTKYLSYGDKRACELVSSVFHALVSSAIETGHASASLYGYLMNECPYKVLSTIPWQVVNVQ